MEYNIYCDESCYMLNDDSNIMAIGGIWCPINKVTEITNRIKEIKNNYGYPVNKEVKWTKISNFNKQMYLDLVNFFFDYTEIYFRIIIIDKRKLHHDDFHQTHDTFYYKMYFLMLSSIFNKDDTYSVYVDIKDTHSYKNCQKLLDVCANSNWDFHHKLLKKIQPIRSEESQLLQLADILIGAITFNNRFINNHEKHSQSKLEIINKIKER